MTSKQKADMQDGAPPYITPKGKEEFERNLLRKMSDIMQHWRNCRVPKCRRGRGCASSRLFCLRRNPAPASAQEWDHTAAQLRRAIQQRLRELSK